MRLQFDLNVSEKPFGTCKIQQGRLHGEVTSVE